MSFSPLYSAPNNPNLSAIVERLAGVVAAANDDDELIGMLGEVCQQRRSAIVKFVEGEWLVNLAACQGDDGLSCFADGTSNAYHGIGDAIGTFPITPNLGGPTVHSFFLPQATNFISWLNEWTGGTDWRNGMVTGSGHSLGGGSMGILGLIQAIQTGPQLSQTANFASPRYLVSGWRGPFPANSWNIFYGQDIVPFVPNRFAQMRLVVMTPPVDGSLGTPVFWGDYDPKYSYGDTNAVLHVEGFFEWPLRLQNQIATNFNDHYLQAHVNQVAAWALAGLIPAKYTPIVNRMVEDYGHIPPLPPLPPAPPVTEEQATQINLAYFPGVSPPPITPENASQVTFTGSESQGPFPDNSRDIATTRANTGARFMAAQGFKITAFLQDGPRGWSFSLYTNAQTLGLAQQQWQSVQFLMVQCLGATLNGGNSQISLGQPVITYVRFTPVNIATGVTLLTVMQGNYSIPPGGNFGAEPPSVALFQRLQVVSGAGQRATRNFFLHGIPDGAIQNEVYLPSFAGWLDSNIRAFWNFLFSGGVNGNNPLPWMQILAEDLTAPAGGLQQATYTGGQWVFNATGLGNASGGYTALAPNDRIRISRCNSNQFNGVWKISAIGGSPVYPPGAGTITLAGGPYAQAPIPTIATWQKVYDAATRKRCQVFIPFTASPSWTTPTVSGTVFLVRKRNVGIPFSPFRTRRRRRRVAV